MKTIRKGTFETNSSSVHSLVIMSKDEYNEYQQGTIGIDIRTDKLISTKTLPDSITKIKNGYIYNNEFFSDIEDLYKKLYNSYDIVTVYNENTYDIVTKEMNDNVAISINKEV